MVKKIKYDGNIDKATEFEQNIGQKLDQLLQSMTDIKGEIDNISVGMLTGNDSLDTGADFGDESGIDALADFDPSADTDTAPEMTDNSEFDAPELGDEDLSPKGREVK